MGNLVWFLVTVFVLVSCISVEGQTTTVCSITCPTGEVLDEPACKCVTQNPTIIPTSKCPEIKCAVLYPPCRIYKKDIQGCPTCQCLLFCPSVTCPKKCGSGTEELIDTYGCPFCRCKQPPKCKPFACKLYCPNGYEKDRLGCDICKCKPCDDLCRLKCQYGYLVDFNGCTICECKPKPECGPVCYNFCPYCRLLDEYGCPTCQCLPNPECKPLTCLNYCEYGRVLDDQGCPTCQCLELA